MKQIALHCDGRYRPCVDEIEGQPLEGYTRKLQQLIEAKVAGKEIGQIKAETYEPG